MDLVGGCLCGAVRYKSSRAPVRQFVCHCRDCPPHVTTPLGAMPYFEHAAHGDADLAHELDLEARWQEIMAFRQAIRSPDRAPRL